MVLVYVWKCKNEQLCKLGLSFNNAVRKVFCYSRFESVKGILQGFCMLPLDLYIDRMRVYYCCMIVWRVKGVLLLLYDCLKSERIECCYCCMIVWRVKEVLLLLYDCLKSERSVVIVVWLFEEWEECCYCCMIVWRVKGVLLLLYDCLKSERSVVIVVWLFEEWKECCYCCMIVWRVRGVLLLLYDCLKSERSVVIVVWLFEEWKECCYCCMIVWRVKGSSVVIVVWLFEEWKECCYCCMIVWRVRGVLLGCVLRWVLMMRMFWGYVMSLILLWNGPVRQKLKRLYCKNFLIMWDGNGDDYMCTYCSLFTYFLSYAITHILF